VACSQYYLHVPGQVLFWYRGRCSKMVTIINSTHWQAGSTLHAACNLCNLCADMCHLCHRPNSLPLAWCVRCAEAYLDSQLELHGRRYGQTLTHPSFGLLEQQMHSTGTRSRRDRSLKTCRECGHWSTRHFAPNLRPKAGVWLQESTGHAVKAVNHDKYNADTLSGRQNHAMCFCAAL
jgi:hypothetical protein